MDLEAQVQALEARVQELELLMLAHRANLVREEWIGDEEMLQEIAGFMNEAMLNISTKSRPKDILAQYLINFRNAKAKQGIDAHYRQAIRGEIRRLRQKSERGRLIREDGSLDIS